MTEFHSASHAVQANERYKASGRRELGQPTAGPWATPGQKPTLVGEDVKSMYALGV